jgi:hypothetical protein
LHCGETVGLLHQLRHRGGARGNWTFIFTAAAFNLVRMRSRNQPDGLNAWEQRTMTEDVVIIERVVIPELMITFSAPGESGHLPRRIRSTMK